MHIHKYTKTESYRVLIFIQPMINKSGKCFK